MPPPSPITFDDTLWPLLIIHMTGVPTTAQFEEYLAMRTTLLLRGEPHVTLLEAVRLSTLLPAEQRQRQAAWIREHAPSLRRLVLGSAIILTSPLARMTLSVILHLQPLPVPYLVTATVPAAADWALRLLEEAGLGAEARRIREQLALSSTEQP